MWRRAAAVLATVPTRFLAERMCKRELEQSWRHLEQLAEVDARAVEVPIAQPPDPPDLAPRERSICAARLLLGLAMRATGRRLLQVAPAMSTAEGENPLRW